MSHEAFKRLAKLVVRSFYGAKCPPAGYRDDEDNESARNKLKLTDTTGLGVILIDYLVEKDGWVAEEELRDMIKVNLKLMRRALKYLEHEQIIMSTDQRETARGQKHNTVKQVIKAEAKAMKAGGGQEEEEEEEEELHQTRTYSYFAMDFPRFFDSIQLRLHLIKKKLKDELEDKEVLVKYYCSSCNKQFDSYEVAWLVEPSTGDFACDLCSSKILPLLASGETGDEAARRQRRLMISTKLHKMDAQFRDIHQLVSALASRPLAEVPFCGTLREWAARKLAQQRAGLEGLAMRGGGGGGGGGGGRANQGFTTLASNPADFWQETQIEVNLGGGGGGGGGGGAAPVASSLHPSSSMAHGTHPAPAASKPSNLPSFLRPAASQSKAVAPAAGSSGGLGGEKAEGASVVSNPEEERRKAYYAAYMAQLAAQQAEKERNARVALGGMESEAKRQRVEIKPEVGVAVNNGDGGGDGTGEGEDEWEDV